MQNILNQPVPFYTNWKKVILRYFFVGCFIALFLIFFQPFGTANAKIPNKNLFLSGYGIITFIAFVFTFVGLPQIFQRFIKEEKWVLWKQMLLTLFALSLTFLGCYLYLELSARRPISFNGFLYFYRIALPIALIPLVIISLLDYIYQLKQNQALARDFNEHISPKEKKSYSITLLDENNRPDFTFTLDQLIFVKAANNYVEINYLEEGNIKKHLLRNSIGNVEEQLSSPSIKRCHRSYLVNLDKAGRITGNAQGYKIHFPFTAEFVVPVSRSKGKELLASLKDNKR